MTKKSRPRCGSHAFYPRKRAAQQRPSFSSMPEIPVQGGEGKPICFFGYKAGMTHVLGRDSHSKGTTFGQEVAIPVTIIETPPAKVFGIRAYGKSENCYGSNALFDVFAEKTDKALQKRMPNFRHKKPKKEGKGKTIEKEKKEKTVSDLENLKGKDGIYFALLAHTQPEQTTIGKKVPDISEIPLSGNAAQQLAFAKNILGKELKASDVFNALEFVDVKAVTKGKGYQGVIKRFGVRKHRPKAKYRRVVGSIGPWNPSTVMWTVPRPGQMGYHSRTELNKKILKIGEKPEEINPAKGFLNYGPVKSQFIILAGSVPGPAKREIALRKPVRKVTSERHKIESIDFIATRPEATKLIEGDEKLLQKIEVKEEKKAEKKSVQEEIAEASKGQKK